MKTAFVTSSAILALFALSSTLNAQRISAEQNNARNSAQRESQQEQQEQQQQQRRRGQPQIDGLERAESAAILPFYQAVQAQSWDAATAALPAAEAGAQTPAGRFLVGQLLFSVGTGTQNAQTQARAVDLMLASGGAPADRLPILMNAQVDFAIQAQNWPAAEAALTRMIEVNPNDTAALSRLAQVKTRLNKRDEATGLFRRVLEISQASGQQAPEAVYQTMLATAYEARQAPQALEAARQLVAAYPTPTNWRSALAIYRQLSGLTGAVDLDARRLMRAARALEGERDYVDFADALNRSGLPGEAKAVLDEGFARNQFQGGANIARELQTAASARVTEDRASLPGLRSTALGASGTGQQARTAGDVFYGYGEYADAAALYRAALQKGGEDANLLNLRLGASLAQAGQRAEAEAALRAVTGERAGIAQFWLLWLQRRPAA